MGLKEIHSVEARGRRWWETRVDGESTTRDRKASLSPEHPATPSRPRQASVPSTTFSLLLPQDESCRKAGSQRLKAAISTAPSCLHLILPNGSKAAERVELVLRLQIPEQRHRHGERWICCVNLFMKPCVRSILYY